MPDKFFDILPPKTQLSPRPEILPPKPVKKKIPKRKKSLILVVVLVILILTGFFSYFALSRAQIEIWPETQTLNFKEKIEINSQKTQPDFSAKIFPGKIFEVEKELSQEFPATGETLKTAKAQGQIRAYNAYSDSSQVLIANTRFISAEGKLFRSLENVTIPGGVYDEKGKLTPGFLDIKVVAAEPGEEYNIGPSTFSIPGFAGTPRYTAFYGKSFSAMTGGFKGEASQVTQEDLDKAKDVLSNKLFEEGKTVLKNKISPEFVLLNEAISQEIIEATSSLQAGAEAQNFNFRVKIRLKSLAFKKSDLENFARGFILAKLPQDEFFSEEDFWLKKKIQEESLKINYVFSSIDWKEEKIILNLEISAKIYPSLNETTFKKALFGKSLKETQILLADQPQIKKSEVKFWPFWVKKVPQKEEKIEIKLNLEG